MGIVHTGVDLAVELLLIEALYQEAEQLATEAQATYRLDD
jgi:hypothetical protein